MAAKYFANKVLKILTSGALFALLPVLAAGSELPQTFQAGRQTLHLRGEGILKYALVFEVYSAGLYLPADVPSEQVLEDVPKRLEIHYNYAITARDVVRSKKEILARNWPQDVIAAEKKKLKQFDRAYVDIKPGDVYALTYIPGRGTELSLNGRRQLSVSGPRIAALMFSIWLGKKPLDDGVKRLLLGYD